MSLEGFDYLFKLVIIGDSFVGKTTLLQRFVGSRDVGVQRHVAEKIIHHWGKRIKLQIVDTMGQERYRSLTSSYYRGTTGCIVCFDKRNKDSLENVKSFWISDMIACVGNETPKLLVSLSRTKSDRDRFTCTGSESDAQEAEVNSLCENYSMPHLDVVLDSPDEVENAFTTIADLIIHTLNEKVLAKHSSVVDLSQPPKAKPKKCAC